MEKVIISSHKAQKPLTVNDHHTIARAIIKHKFKNIIT